MSILPSISQNGLLCLVAQMTAAADFLLQDRNRPLGERNRWTMLVYMDVEVKKKQIDMRYIERLERSINQELVYYGHPPVSFAEIIGGQA